MIIEGVCRFAANLIIGLFSLIEAWSLPTGMIGALANILKYGSWVVGGDVLLLVSGSVVMWWGVKASVGVAIWVYDKLPLT